MSESHRTLSYETPRSPAVRWWSQVWKFLLWPLILINIYGGACLSLVFLILGIISLFHPVDGLYLFGKPVVTVSQRVEWIIFNAALTAVCQSLIVRHLRRISRRHHATHVQRRGKR